MEENKGIIYKSTFKDNLRELRKEKKLSQKEFAKMLGVPSSTYANWEQGRREPNVSDIFNIITTLGIEPNELFNI
ncbi:MAG: helix-turn-helix transcriptional regulator [Clostridia bacterium]|nr:helix-turn-helix transcriptional regulator [Clostridia bacterium]